MDLEKKLKFLTGSDEYSDIPQVTKYDLDQIRSEASNLIEVMDDNSVDDRLPESLSIDSYLRLSDSKEKRKPKKQDRTRSELFDQFDEDDIRSNSILNDKSLRKLRTSKVYKKITKRMSEDMIDDFETFLGDDSNFESEDSDDLKNGLISMGRKYARETSVSAENSELAKVFSTSEKKLKDLYDEITRDKIGIQKDIDQMRAMTRGKNFKVLSDLYSSKTSFHQAQLSAIKEANAIKKSQFEMMMKEKAAKLATASGGTDDLSAATIKNLFGAGRDNILGSVGGYTKISGAVDQEFDAPIDDDYIETKYFSDEPEEETDGDKFLKYEGKGVEYVLLLDDDNKPVDVVAEDNEGNIIPDYPMPSNVDQLHFQVDRQTGYASDDLHRKYKIRDI